jgi:excisionase family DNA binding protein
MAHTATEQTVSPKQVARAIGVSESSVKRWCDKGAIATVRTGGGHRRIALAAVLAFLRENKHELLHPDILGLPATSGSIGWVVERAKERFEQTLLDGNEAGCFHVLLDQYLAGRTVSEIGDQIVAQAFHSIGAKWACGAIDVYHERRGCELCIGALVQMRSLLPPPGQNAPVAIGATITGDQYAIPGLLVDLVLRENGWQSTWLGGNLPIASLIEAVRQNTPAMIWLSLSHIAEEEEFLTDYRDLHMALPKKTAIIVGGRAITESIRREMRYFAHCDHLEHLAEVATRLRENIE